jgi:hypothetical protein
MTWNVRLCALALLMSVLGARAEDAGDVAALSQQNTKVGMEAGRDAEETRLYSSAAADLRGDGTTLLVVGGYTGAKDKRIADVSIYSRGQDSSWKLEARALRAGEPQSTIRNVAAADLDGDKTAEVIALGWIGGSFADSEAQLSIYRLDKGTLIEKASVQWKTGANAHGYGLAVGDLDRDGRPEIVSGGFGLNGDEEAAELRVWRWRDQKLVLAAEAHFGGQGFKSARINAIAVGDLDGDGRAEIVTSGREGELKNPAKALKKERGEVTAWVLKGNQLVVRARQPWLQGEMTRLRALRIADIDGDSKPEVVAGGKCESEGRACLLVLQFKNGKFETKATRTAPIEEGPGEIKDLIVVNTGAGPRVVTTGPKDAKPDRRGVVQLFRIERGQLVLEDSAVSVQGDETRARSIFVWPGKGGLELFTIGHTLSGRQMLGQLLEWSPLLKLETSGGLKKNAGGVRF